jgi:CRP-like cAMP-binding protein
MPLLISPLFSGLEPAQLKTIAVLSERVAFDDGIDLIRDGEAGDAAYVIAAGRVAVRAPDEDEPVEIELGAGSVVGELAMFVDMVHEATVTALGEVSALRIPRAAMQEALAENPALAEHFVGIMRNRLEALAGRLREADSLLDAGRFEDEPPAARLH